MRFKVGDKVQVISGSPNMTLDELAPPRAHCTWFDEDGKPCSRWFAISALQEVD
jgi:uncharacterized protein YodC (DUF2158 family)